MSAATCVLFIQGGGQGAYHEDAPLADSLKRALGPEYDVRYPQMPGEDDPNVESWKRKISSELSRTRGKVVLVAHCVGGSILLRYLAHPHHGMNSFGSSRTHSFTGSGSAHLLATSQHSSNTEQ